MLSKLPICAILECGYSLTNYCNGAFWSIHHDYEDKCGVQGCVYNVFQGTPTTLSTVQTVWSSLWTQLINVCKQVTSLLAWCNCSWWCGEAGVGASSWTMGLDNQAFLTGTSCKSHWDCCYSMWNPSVAYKISISEGTNKIVQFMNDTWPSNHTEHQPSFLAVIL